MGIPRRNENCIPIPDGLPLTIYGHGAVARNNVIDLLMVSMGMGLIGLTCLEHGIGYIQHAPHAVVWHIGGKIGLTLE